MSFIKFPKPFADIVVSDDSFPLYFRLFLYLAFHCDFPTGRIHTGLSASKVAKVLGCSRRSVYRNAVKLRELGWLVGGTGLSGTLAGFKTRPYRSAASVQQAQIRAVLDEVAPRSPSSNGSRPPKPRKPAHIPVREQRDTVSFQEVLSRAKRNIPEG